jgi:hypothetical protein
LLDAQRRATAPLAYGVGRLDVRDELAPSSRRQSLWDGPPPYGLDESGAS